MNDTPIYVALSEGFFRKNGVDLRLIPFSTAAPQLEALKAGDVQLVNASTITVLRAVEKHIPLLAVADYMNGIPTDLTLRTDVLRRAKLGPSASLQRRLAVLKGLTLGVEAAGGVVDGLTRYIVRDAHLRPGKDVRIVSIGGPGALVAAMQHGQIDGFMAAPPWPQQTAADGFGTVVVSGPKGDIHGFEGAINDVIAVDPAYARAHPNVIRAVVRAVAEGTAFVAAHPKRTTAILAKNFKKLTPSVVAASVKELAPAFPVNVRMSKKGWAEAENLWRDAGIFKRAVPTSQGTVWTNRYIGH